MEHLAAGKAEKQGLVHRSVLGALLIGIINNGLSILNVSIELQLVVKGVIIVLALALDRYLQFKSRVFQAKRNPRRKGHNV